VVVVVVVKLSAAVAQLVTGMGVKKGKEEELIGEAEDT
jgi:hypothetical protein